MKKLFFILPVLFSLNGYSQITGYFGKKLSIEAGLGITPCIYQKNDVGLHLSTSFNGSIGMVMSRKSSFHINTSFSKPDFGFQSGIVGGQVIQEDNNYEYEIWHEDAKEVWDVGIVEARVLQLEGVFKFFQGNFISPVGRYFLLGAGITRFSLNEPGVKMMYMYESYPTQIIKSATLVQEEEYYQKLNLIIGLGKGIALNRSLILDLQLVSSVSFIREEVPYRYSKADSYIYHNIWRDLKWREAMQFNIHLKYLIF